MYSSYIQSRGGGCTSCGLSGNTRYREQYSPSYVNNRYSNNYNNIESYNNRVQRVLTPTRQYNYNNSNRYSYLSPNRTSGCTSCSMNSSSLYQSNNYERPYSPVIKRNVYNSTMDLFNRSSGFNDEFKFKSKYVLNRDNKNDDDIPLRYLKKDRNNDNRRQYSPINEENKNEFSYKNNYRNYYDNSNDKYKTFLSTNINRYNINPINLRYNSPTRKYYDNDRGNNRLYYSSSFKKSNQETSSPSFYRREYKENNDMDRTNNRYLNNNLYRSRFENISSTNSKFDQIMSLNLYNYRSPLRSLIQEKKTFFVCIYGSVDYTGKSWCSDCNIAKPNLEQAKNIVIEKKYEKEVYYISIPIEKIELKELNKDYDIRLERVPTLIFFENGIEKNRMVENELFSYSSVRNFVLQAYDNFYNRRYERY
jgi:thiol-disulfide isomerase/thioredoxin